MNEHADQLRQAFETHEYLAPDAATVYARVEELARSYNRRRRGVQAVSGAVLGAGLVAGGANISALLPGGSSETVIVQPAAGTTAAPTPTISPMTPSEEEYQRLYSAYATAGYGYEEALKLAKIWKIKGDLSTVKAEAGRRLLAGEKLPVKPGPEPSVPGPGSKESAAVNAFFEAGYTVDDAVQLAELWKTADAYHAKVEGGKKLLAGQTLPIQP